MRATELGEAYVEAVGGVAGDMLLGAFIDLGADVEAIRAAVSSLGVPGLELEIAYSESQGERACTVRSMARQRSPHGRHLEDIFAILRRGEMTAPARATAERVFTILADAEGKSHGAHSHHVHLHEVGEIDSILDVAGIAVAYDNLGAPPLSVGALPSGCGTVDCAHGRLELPAPAVQHIAHSFGLDLVDVPVQGETVTPTGAAVLAALCRDVHAVLSRPGDRVGVGAGTRRFPDRPNVVRVHGYRA
jgi:pyridinium-3,5-bisthiocarboxylic acid mononucleotide nickel chelatase